jgi:hypothetical protein
MDAHRETPGKGRGASFNALNLPLPPDRDTTYTILGEKIEEYVANATAAARNHAEVWMHKVEDIRVEVNKQADELAALRAERDRLREALGRIARNGKMSTASNADERLVDCVALINSMIDEARSALVQPNHIADISKMVGPPCSICGATNGMHWFHPHEPGHP